MANEVEKQKVDALKGYSQQQIDLIKETLDDNPKLTLEKAIEAVTAFGGL